LTILEHQFRRIKRGELLGTGKIRAAKSELFSTGPLAPAYTHWVSARGGRLLLKGDTVRACFNLTGATFFYGPIQTWPRWPGPPVVEVVAVQATLENGDWLALADGLRPESLPNRSLPQ